LDALRSTNANGRAAVFFLISAIVLFVSVGSVVLRVEALTDSDLITNFDSFIYLTKDSSLRISETIDIYFGQRERHSIVRMIPLTTELAHQTRHIYVKVSGVTCDGRAVGHKETFQDDKLKIEIENDSRQVVGQHKFVISYTAQGTVRSTEKGPELAWNVTGNDWTLPIERASVAFCPPSGIAPRDLVAESFVSNSHSSIPGLASSTDKAILFKAYNLTPGRSLTITVQLPQGSTTVPGSTSEFGWMVDENYAVAMSIITGWGGWLLLALIPIVILILKFSNGGPPPPKAPPKATISYRSNIR
jgi:hypothetical protein